MQLLSTKECLNAKKSKDTYPESVHNQRLDVLVIATRRVGVAVVRPSPSYVAATSRKIDNPREILPN